MSDLIIPSSARAYAPAFRQAGGQAPFPTAPSQSKSVEAWEPVVAMLLSMLNLVTLSLFDADGQDWLNVASPLILTAALALGALRSILKEPDRIWTPLFWFRVSTGIYFGFGSIVPLISNESTKDLINSFYQLFGNEISKLNLLVSLGIMTVFVVDITLSRRWPQSVSPTPDKTEQDYRHRRLAMLGISFLVVGEILQLTIVVFRALANENASLPGFLATLTLLGPVGIYMFSVWCFARRTEFIGIAIFAVVIEIVLGLLAFEKSTPVMALLMFVLAWLRSRPTIWRAATAIAVLVAFYTAITPVVTYSRAELGREFGSFNGVSLQEAVGTLLSYTPERASSVEDGEQTQNSLARISYSAPAAFVVHQYDIGAPGDSFKNWLAVLIPRFIWADKPEITGMGKEVTMLANGTDNSQTGIGVFAESYWNFGWWGIFIAMIPIGLLLSLWTRYSMDVMRNGRWIFFPVVLLGMKIGIRADGNFVPDFLGATIIAIGFHVIIVIGDHLLSELRGVRSPIATRGEIRSNKPQPRPIRTKSTP